MIIQIIMGIYIGVQILRGLHAYYNRPKAKVRGRDEVKVPRVESGAPYPIIWGTVRMQQPLLVDFFGFHGHGIPNGPPGYASYWMANMFFVLAARPYKADSISVNRLWVGDFPVLAGPFPTGQDHLIDSALGEDAGFVNGQLRVWDGGPTQTIVGKFLEGFNQFASGTIYTYRDRIAVSLAGNRLLGDLDDGWKFTMPASIPDPYSFEVSVRAVPPWTAVGGAVKAWEPPILTYDVSPIFAIYDLLTNTFYGLGEPTTKIDETSFAAAATALGIHGISRMVTEAIDARALIREICDEIDAMIYEEPKTGKYVIKLIRDDYDPATLPVYDETFLVTSAQEGGAPPEMTIGTWEDTYTEVRVHFTDRFKDFTIQTATTQNLALIARFGKVRTLDLYYPGISNLEVATRVARRELREASVPLKRLKITLDRRAYDLRPGSLFKFTWPDWGTTALIFRVANINAGTLDNGLVQIEAVQDVFGLVSTGLFIPEPPFNVPPEPTLIPPPLADRFETEAPRWIQRRAADIGIVTDLDEQHVWGYSAPNIGDAQARQDAGSQFGGDLYSEETQFVPFAHRALVETTYPRTLDPYDTTTGLRINTASGLPPGPTSVAQIRDQGKALALVGSTPATAELIAFESYTDLGGGVYRLNNVWRGLLDTTPRDHAVGTRVWFVSQQGWTPGHDANRVGSSAFLSGDIVSSKMVPRGTFAHLGPDQVDAVQFSITKRTTRPYPAADFKLNSSKAITVLDKEGMRGEWKRRNFDSTTIVRGDSADESVALEFHRAYAQKVGGAEVALAAQVNGTGQVYYHLGKNGHGAIDVKLRTERGAVTSWMDSVIRVNAPTWRNLLLNPDFDGGQGGDGSSNTANWIAEAGTTFTTGNAAGEMLGGTGRYLQFTSSGGGEIRQTVDVSGYGPSTRMTARLRLYGHNLAAAADTIRAYIELLNAADAVVGTVDTGVVAPSNADWDRYDIAVAWVATAVKIRIRLITASVVELDPSAAVITGLRLTLGQSTANLLLNPSFETGLGSWVVGAGGFTLVGTPSSFEGGNYVRGSGLAGTDEFYQQPNVSAGFEANAVAVFECTVTRDGADPDDTGEVIVEARNAAGNLISSTSSGVIAPSLGNLIWQRVLVTHDLPPDTISVRARLRATRVNDAGACNVGFDDCDLAIHKHLAPSFTLGASKNLSKPAVFKLPKTVARWWQDYRFSAPNYAFFDGKVMGSLLPNAPAFTQGTPPTGVTTQREFIGGFDGTSFTRTDCYEFNSGDLICGDDTYFANFGSLSSWGATVTFRIDPRSFNAGTGCGLIGRLGARGWSLHVHTDGKLRAQLVGVGGTVTLDSVATVNDGLVHQAHIRYTGGTLQLILDGVLAAVAAAAAGEFGVPAGTSVGFRIGRAIATQTLCAGQIAMVGLWYGATLLPTAAQLQGAWTYGADPSGLGGISGTATGRGCTLVIAGDDFALARWSPVQRAFGYHQEMDVGGGTGYGLTCQHSYTNLANSDFDDVAKWDGSLLGGFSSQRRDLEGFMHAAQFTGTDGEPLKALALALGAVAADFRVSLFVRRSEVAEDGEPIKIELRTDGGVLKDTETAAVDAEWTRVDVTLSWDGAAAVGELWIYPSNDANEGTILMSGPVIVHKAGAFWPVLMTTPSAAQAVGDVRWSVPIAVTPTSGKGIYFDGEVVVEGITNHEPAVTGGSAIAFIGKDAGTINARMLEADSNADLTFAHFNATDVGVISEVAPAATDWEDPWTLRMRWSRSLLLRDDGTLTYATLYGSLYFVNEAGAIAFRDNDLTAQFTVEEFDTLLCYIGGYEDTSAPPITALIQGFIVRSREEEGYP